MATGAQLKRIREATNLSAQRLAGLIGVDLERLKKWEQRDQNPRNDDAEKILSFFQVEKLTDLENVPKVPQTNNTTLKDGSDRKEKEVIPVGKHVPLRLSLKEYEESFEDWVGLPIYNEPITASFVATYRDTEVHKPQYYLHDPRFRDCDFGAVITGDSMHPEIRHGDIVACKLINDKTFIVFGDIYYIVASNGLETCKYVQRVKRIKEGAERRGKGNSKYSRYDENDVIYDDTQILLVPYNTSIDPSPILKEMIEKLYKVRGIIRGY